MPAGEPQQELTPASLDSGEDRTARHGLVSYIQLRRKDKMQLRLLRYNDPGIQTVGVYAELMVLERAPEMVRPGRRQVPGRLTLGEKHGLTRK